jgi:hypothetical protein
MLAIAVAKRARGSDSEFSRKERKGRKVENQRNRSDSRSRGVRELRDED